MLNALDALHDANLMSPRPNEWATLREINAAADPYGSSNITHSTMSRLVKGGSVESATIDGQTMYRAAGQAIRPGGGESKPRPQPEQDYVPGQDQDPRGGKDDVYDPYADDPKYYGRGGGAPAGGPVVPAPVGGIVSGTAQQIIT